MRRLLIAVGIVLFFGCTCPGTADERPSPAAEILTSFFAAMREKNIDAMMATVEVPWFHSGKRMLERKEDLRQEWERLFGNPDKDYRQLEFHIKQDVAYGSIRAKIKDEERQLLDKVLKEGDRVVLVEIDNKKKKLENVALMIRIRDGNAKVVGLRD